MPLAARRSNRSRGELARAPSVDLVGLLGFALLVALAPTCAQAGQLTAGEVLQKTSETYRKLRNYRFMAVKESVLSAMQIAQSGESQITLAVAQPGKVRLNLKNPQQEIIIVSDGETTWTCLPKRKQYSKVSGATSGAGGDDESEGGGETDVLTEMQRVLVGRYQGISRYATEATLGKDERLKVGGKKLDCYVVQLRVKGVTHKLWIDQERFLVLRHKETSTSVAQGVHVTQENTLNVKEAEIAIPSESGLFEFTPPAGSSEVATLGLPGERVSLVGKVAPDFTLKSLQGEKIALSDLRGKIVLLDFWATWCGPCRKELPDIEKLFQKYQDKDVVILAIDDEESGTIKSFLKKHNYDFTTLVDSNQEVHRKYSTRAIPTVLVINRQGVVVDHFVGGRSEEELTAALKNAGA